MSRLAALLALLALVASAQAQTVSGTIFHDRNGNGLQEAGEEALEDVAVRLAGQTDAAGAFDQTLSTDAAGLFSFAPGNGCYLLRVEDPPGWRRTLARFDERAAGSAGYTEPVGLRRFGGAPLLLDRLLGGGIRYSSLGDSIAWNWNSCFDTSSFWYSQQVESRLECVAGSANVSLDEAAVKGEHSDDLLVDETNDLNNVFRIIEAQSDLVTISIIGNDLLDAEPGGTPTQEDINRVAEELIDARSNIQEVLSALVSEIPHATVELNTLYDNLAWECGTTPSTTIHVEWVPILNRILRDVAWGQTRRVTNAEVFPEFSHEDLLGDCTGFLDQICHFLGDDIHPRESGFEIIREKVWESLGGAQLGPRDALGATSIAGADHGYLRRVRRLYPSAWQELGGATVDQPGNALDGDDGGAGATVRLGLGGEELRLSGFPSWLDEIVPVRVVVGVRYRTTGTVAGDFYRFEASVDGSFRPPPGHPYSPTDWNYYTPIVGSGGPNAPASDPDYSGMETLVRPEVASYREASATLTKNPVITPDGRGYDWPALTLAELGTTEVRLAAAPVAGSAADFDVVVDAAWLDVYGQEKPRPGEVTALRVAREADGALTLSFDELGGAARYNLYNGALAPLQADGSFDHGAAPRCDTPTSPAGPGRLEASIPAAEVPAGAVYFLVTGHVDDVESPSGFGAGGEERPRRESSCL